MPVEKRNNINARQIKAARALLDWSQEDLASSSGLSIATIRKIESGSLSPRDKTMGSIVSALEEANIEFTHPDGVRLKNNSVEIIEGDDCYLRLLDMVYYSLNGKNQELLISYADNSLSPQAVVENQHRLRKAGIRIRFLVEEGNTFLVFPKENYRWLPEKYFHNTVVQIFGNKVALSTQKDKVSLMPSKIVIIESQTLSETLRNAFNFMWDNCRKPALSTAPQVFE
jgi:transcriptional regulator with XRE-family HTH domain